jgi:hypothetical protein
MVVGPPGFGVPGAPTGRGPWIRLVAVALEGDKVMPELEEPLLQTTAVRMSEGT